MLNVIDNSEFSLNFIFKMTSIEPENNLTEYKKVPTSCLSSTIDQISNLRNLIL